MSILDMIHKQIGEPPPNRILLLGQEGIGKTTFGATAPKPLFICPEQGLTQFPDIPRFVPESSRQLKEFLDELIALDANPKAPGGSSPAISYETIVIDTVDWLEAMIHADLCKQDAVSSIEDFSKGYGKGYVASAEILKSILNRLDALREKHKIRPILLGHVESKAHNDPNPDLQSWDRWVAKGNKKFIGRVKEWTDVNLFATREMFQLKSGRTEKTISGDHVMFTEWNSAFDAKNRLGLVPKIALDWAEYIAAEKDCEDGPLRIRFKNLFEARKHLLLGDAEIAKWAGALKIIDKLPSERVRKAVTILQQLKEPATESE